MMTFDKHFKIETSEKNEEPPYTVTYNVRRKVSKGSHKECGSIAVIKIIPNHSVEIKSLTELSWQETQCIEQKAHELFW